MRETTRSDGMPVYFIDAPSYFQREKIYGYGDDGERFILFCRAALEFVALDGLGAGYHPLSRLAYRNHPQLDADGLSR